MRLATILEGATPWAAIVEDGRVLPIAVSDPGLRSVRGIASAGAAGLAAIGEWGALRPASAWRRLDDVRLGPVVPVPGAIYTVGLNYAAPGEDPRAGRPERPLIYGKAATSPGAHGGVLAWDRAVTDDVDAECELGVVVGPGGRVFGYTVMNDVSARDEVLDGDQWLLGKSLPGFCPVGPWLVTADELDPADVALGCRINGEPIQDGRTSAMRFTIPEILAYLGRHLALRPGDLVATGTPPRLEAPPGPGRRLRAGDEVTCWIDGIGELATTVA